MHRMLMFPQKNLGEKPERWTALQNFYKDLHQLYPFTPPVLVFLFGRVGGFVLGCIQETQLYLLSIPC